MKKLKENERLYWKKYLISLPENERPVNPNVDVAFAGNKDMTDELLKLYLCGKKTAGSSIVEDYLSTGEALPQVGNFWIYLDSSSEPCCILRTEKIVINKFKSVPAEIAIAEGEGDLSLESWRQIHGEIYSPFLSKWGIANIDDARVITEFFQLVYK